jgi:type II secretory pathway pseudopilin PulG
MIMIRSNKDSSDNKGFSLIEMAIILVIIGLLVGMGAGLLAPLTRRTKHAETRKLVREAYEAIIGYTVSHKMLPSSLSVLGVRTDDPYGASLFYVPAGGITSSNLCTTAGTYITVDDMGSTKTNVAFIVLSSGENVCNQTGTSSPFTILSQGTTSACTQDSNARYDDVVMYQDINFLREKICNSFRIVTSTLPAGKEEEPYPSTTLEATDGTPQLTGPPRYNTWTVTSGSLPPGLALSSQGSISGTPTADGSYNFTVSVTDDESRVATKSLAITIQPNDPKITTMYFHKGTEGTAYSASLAATGGTDSYSWSVVSGSLPPGLSLSGATISGTPTTAGTYAFSLGITDGRGRTDTKSLSITVESSGGGGGGGGGGGSSSALWIGQKGGELQSCDSSGSCTSHGDQGDDIEASASFSAALWIGQKGGELQSCDSSGSCTSHGDQGNDIKSMVEFNSELWIGQKDGELQSCDSSGSCTSHGDKGDDINAMVTFNNKLWLGMKDKKLLSCDTSGSCTNHGSQSEEIKSMAVFSSKLWLGLKKGHLLSCDTTGSCTDHGDKGEDIEAMVSFSGSLWIGQKNGTLRACDSSGSCTSYGSKGDDIKSMAEFSSKLWLGHKGGRLNSCDSSGSCTNHGDQGDDIKTMTAY